MSLKIFATAYIIGGSLVSIAGSRPSIEIIIIIRIIIRIIIIIIIRIIIRIIYIFKSMAS